jgi:hypothetical protein
LVEEVRVRCLTCAYFTARDKDGRVYEMVKHGAWRCLREPGLFRAISAPACERYGAANEDIVRAREIWAAEHE